MSAGLVVIGSLLVLVVALLVLSHLSGPSESSPAAERPLRVPMVRCAMCGAWSRKGKTCSSCGADLIWNWRT